MTEFLIPLTMYVAILVYIGWHLGRTETAEDYLIAGRNRTWIQICFSKYAAAVGAGWFITYTGFSYEYGLGIGAVLLGLTIGFLTFAYWAAPRIYTQGQQANAYTQGDYVTARTGSMFGKQVIDGIAICSAFLSVVVAVVGGGLILREFGIVSYEIGVVVTLAIVLTYSLLSGYRAIMATDVVQGVIMLLLLCAVTWGIFSADQQVVKSFSTLRNISIMEMVAFVILGAVYMYASTERYQMTYAANSIAAVQKGMALSLAPVLVTAGLLFVIGSVVYHSGTVVENGAVFTTALFEFMPQSLMSVALVLFFAAIMSTIDTLLYVIASHSSTLLARPVSKTFVRSMLLITAGLVVVIALNFTDVVDLSLIAAGLLMPAATPMIYLIAGGTNPYRFNSLLVCGLLAGVGGLILLGPEPTSTVTGLLGNAVGALVPLPWLKRLELGNPKNT